jgi:hypothetical protein
VRGKWEVDSTAEVQKWLDDLSPQDTPRVSAALDLLREGGPGLGRPMVDSVKGSRHHNMKELRPRGGNIRVLFAFDPRRHAVLLVGGDKTNDWRGWYERNIPLADRLFDDHLKTIGGGEPWGPGAGRRSEPRCR